MIDTVLVLDTSGSMGGAKLEQLKRAVDAFLNFSKDSGLDDKIAIVEFGNNTCVRTSLSTNYAYHLRVSRDLRAGGSTPMAEGLAYALQELVKNGQMVSLEGVILMPRIILMTDGEPDDRSKTLELAKAIGDAGFPIACVGVSGCDQQLLRTIAQFTGGMFVMTHDISDLYVFFITQFFMVVYIVKMLKELDNLLNREILRAFLEEQLNSSIDNETLDLIVAMLSHMVKFDQPTSRAPAVRTTSRPAPRPVPSQPRITAPPSPQTYTAPPSPAPMRTQKQKKKKSKKLFFQFPLTIAIGLLITSMFLHWFKDPTTSSGSTSTNDACNTVGQYLVIFCDTSVYFASFFVIGIVLPAILFLLPNKYYRRGWFAFFLIVSVGLDAAAWVLTYLNIPSKSTFQVDLVDVGGWVAFAGTGLLALTLLIVAFTKSRRYRRGYEQIV